MLKIKIIKNSLKIFLYFHILFAACYLLTGCATVSTREVLPTYSIDGVTYLPLDGICKSKRIDWEYDAFSKTVVLSRDAHKINLMVGDNLILVDGRAQLLRHAVRLDAGRIVVPARFKEQILDEIFKETYPLSKTALSLSKIKKVVIDAGHGGNDPGAIGKNGLREKDVALDIAKRLSKLLRADGIEVVMTRSADNFVSLSRRVEIANNSNIDFFISIHANANRVRSLAGFEVYYVSTSVNDSGRALEAAQNAKLDLDASCFAGNSRNLQAILWDMIYTHSRAEAIELSRSICRIIDRNLDTRILGIKGARFYVLKGVRMPAVLIETGFLSNQNEERRLKNNYYRQLIAESIEDGIRDYAQNPALTRAD